MRLREDADEVRERETRFLKTQRRSYSTRFRACMHAALCRVGRSTPLEGEPLIIYVRNYTEYVRTWWQFRFLRPHPCARVHKFNSRLPRGKPTWLRHGDIIIDARTTRRLSIYERACVCAPQSVDRYHTRPSRLVFVRRTPPVYLSV